MDHPGSSSDIIRGWIHKGLFHLMGESIPQSDLIDRFSTILHRLDETQTRVITLSGGAASGKSSITRTVVESISDYKVILLSTDAFQFGDRDYRQNVLKPESALEKYNFARLAEVVTQIKTLVTDKQVTYPLYNAYTGSGIPIEGVCDNDTFLAETVSGKVDFIIVEGDFQPLDAVDYSIYLHVPDEVRLANRLRRDMVERGYDDREAIEASFNMRQNWQHFPHTLPIAQRADLLIWRLTDTPADAICYDLYGRT